MEECLWTSRSAGRRGGVNIEGDQTEEAAERGVYYFGRGWQNVAEKGDCGEREEGRSQLVEFDESQRA